MILKNVFRNLKNFEELKKKKSIKINTKVAKYILNSEQKKALENLASVGNKFNVSVLQGSYRIQEKQLYILKELKN